MPQRERDRQRARHFKASDGRPIAWYLDDFTPPWTEPETLLLLHSAMGNSHRFFSWVPPLAARYRVLRMDLRGHGESYKPGAEEEVSLDRLVEDAAELLDAAGAPRAHVVGNSAGGYVAQRLALAHPERVRTLAVYGSTPGLSPAALEWLPRIEREGLREFLADTIAMRFDLAHTDPGLVRWFLDQTAECDPAYVVRFIRRMATLSWAEELGGIRCPTLVVYPGAETVGSTDGYAPFRERVRDVEVKAYEGLPHNICDMVPERCVADLLDFLRRKGGG